MNEHVLVIDCHSIGHMVKHGIKARLSHEGVGTAIIYGFLMQMFQLAGRFNTSRFVFAWDSRRSVRKERYPFYKDRVPKDKSDKDKEFDFHCAEQFVEIRRRVIDLLGYRHSYTWSGYEADDIIAQVVQQNKNHNFIVVSRDNDLLQLLDYCHLFEPSTKVLTTKSTFVKEHGIHPASWVWVKQAAGCSSDTVPGIPGVGEKTAIQYLKKELKSSSKKFASIESKEGRAIIERNEWLVKLPHYDCRDPFEQRRYDTTLNFKEEFRSREGFLALCEMYGLQSFLLQVNEWYRRLQLE